MNILNNYINTYPEYCKFRKRLDTKTLKAYTIDLKQYLNFCTSLHSTDSLSRNTVDQFITTLHKQSFRLKRVKLVSMVYQKHIIDDMPIETTIQIAQLGKCDVAEDTHPHKTICRILLYSNSISTII